MTTDTFQVFVLDLTHGEPGYGQLHREGCSHRIKVPQTFSAYPTQDSIAEAVEKSVSWERDEFTLAGCVKL